MDPKTLQKRMDEIQNSEQIQELFSKLVSRKSGYKTIIEKSKPAVKCSDCNKILSGEEKFCPECGRRVENEQ